MGFVVFQGGVAVPDSPLCRRFELVFEKLGYSVNK